MLCTGAAGGPGEGSGGAGRATDPAVGAHLDQSGITGGRTEGKEEGLPQRFVLFVLSHTLESILCFVGRSIVLFFHYRNEVHRLNIEASKAVHEYAK